jgi:putative transposase
MLMTSYLWSHSADWWALRDPPFMRVRRLLWMKSNCPLLLDEEYTRHPFYGSRKRVVWLRAQGYIVNRKRAQRLMRIPGLVAMAPGPNTSEKHPQNTVHPYLPRGLEIIRPGHVWSADITYRRLAHGFAYGVAIIDGCSRKVLAWQVSNTMDAGFCVDCLTAAIHEYGVPEIFNTDQGSQLVHQ